MGTCKDCKHWKRFKPYGDNPTDDLGSCGIVVEALAPLRKPEAKAILVTLPQEEKLMLYRGAYGCNQFEAKR
jgi:hypothetical protein